MSDKAALLAMVKDIQEPVAPATSSVWLFGLSLLAALLVLLLLMAYYFWKKQAALRELRKEIASFRQLPQHRCTTELAVLLRRVMHHLHGDTVNQLEGADWLKKLNTTFATNYFTDGRGQRFGSALYQRSASIPDNTTDSRQLCNDVSHLLGRAKLSR